MDSQAVFLDVMSTPSEDVGDLPDEALVVAAVYAADHGEALGALMLGVEIGLRESARSKDGSLLGKVSAALGA